MLIPEEINRTFYKILHKAEPALTQFSAFHQESRILSSDELNDFIVKIREAGTKFDLVFFENTVSPDDFENLLNEARYPFLYFIETSVGIQPRLFSRSETAVSSWSFENGKAEELPRTEAGIKSVVQRTDGSGNTGTPVITCFPLNESGEQEEQNSMGWAGTRLSMFSRLAKMLAPERKEILLILMYAIFVGLIGLSLPLGVQSLIGFISSGQVVTSAIILITFIIIGIILSGLMTIFQLELVEFLQQKLFVRTAFAFASRIPRLRLEAVLKYYPPELMNRFFDTLTLQKGVPVILIDLSAAVLQVFLGIILLSLYHPLFILLGSVIVTVLIIILKMTGPRGIRTALQESEHKYLVANWLEEMARSLTTFKLAGNSGFAMERTDYHVSNYVRARESHFRVLKIQYYSFVAFKTVITAMLLILGTVLIVNRQINLGQFVAAEIVIILIMNSIEKIIMKLDDVYDVLVGVEKITKVTGLPVETSKGIDLPVKTDTGMAVNVKKVSFRFPDRTQSALTNVNLEVKAGERICIAGSNGSGKSTLLNLLLGLYDSYTGTITYNNVSLRELNKSSLMNHLGNYVDQDDLFDGTVLENITIGRRKILAADVFWAAEAAGLTEYINSLPDGYHTRLTGGGIRVPESVRHKMMIARNIVEHPSLLLVDNFLQGVEQGEKKRILDVLLNRQFNWTLIIISNDPMVLSSCERIIVMKDGTVHDDGPAAEMLSRNAELKEIIQQHD